MANKKSSDKHVVKNDGRWSVKEGGAKVSSHRTQELAIEKAITRARHDGTDVVVHGVNGRIRSKDSYGNDPRSIKDTEN